MCKADTQDISAKAQLGGAVTLGDCTFTLRETASSTEASFPRPVDEEDI